MKKIKYYLYLFVGASMLGWEIEILFSLIFRNKFIIPGTTSPFCPIYGVGLVTMIIILYKNKNKILAFLEIFLATTLIEYVSAYISEVYFNNKIWDYTGYILNIDGRVCLLFSLIWGVLGYLFIYHLEPKLNKLYVKYNNKKSDWFFFTLLFLFIMTVLVKLIVK